MRNEIKILARTIAALQRDGRAAAAEPARAETGSAEAGRLDPSRADVIGRGFTREPGGR
ncbi:hypothetical protein D3C83_189190 [compost metagenome]